MADLGYIRTVLGGVQDPALKDVLTQAFTYVLNTLSVSPQSQTAHPRAGNFQLYWQPSTTAASTGEFAVAHGMAMTPKLAIPVLDLTSSGGQFVPLTVTRPADSRYVYFKTNAGSTNAKFALLTE